MGYHLNARYGAAGNAPGRLWRGLVAVILSFALFLQGAIPVQAALFGSFGVKDEKELGRKFDVLVRSRMPLVEDPEIKGYIQSIVDRLSKTFPPQPFPFTANVLLHNSMNAFAVPGGSVFVHTGLIMQLDHESELAGVLGHELAHVTQRHIATRMERAQAVTIGSLVGALAAALLGGGQGSGAIFAGSVAAGQAAMLNYSRMDETEADQIGLQYLTSAGYRPQGLQGAFEKIRRKQWASGIDIPEYLSTHPDVGGRINEIHARIQGLPAAVRNRKDDDTRFNRVKTLIWARYGDPDAAARFFAKQLEGKKPDCLAYMGQGILAERRNQIKDADAAFSKALACAPATLSSYARQGGSITTRAMPGRKNTAPGAGAGPQRHHGPVLLRPAAGRQRRQGFRPQILSAGPPQAPAGRGSALLLWTFARRGRESIRRLPASRLQLSVSERQAQDRKLAQAGPPACPNARRAGSAQAL